MGYLAPPAGMEAGRQALLGGKVPVGLQAVARSIAPHMVSVDPWAGMTAGDAAVGAAAQVIFDLTRAGLISCVGRDVTGSRLWRAVK
ncbi:hypothetical protein D0838_04990 [Bordetella avium]|nr:hypothetical protein C0J09_13955 [Bordetella avium]RIQ74557.1 hypothetical protein D0838_04990 [Bordetella avium]